MIYDAIFLDMDGIQANFHLEAIRAHMRVGHRFPTINHNGAPQDLTSEQLHALWPLGKSLQRAFFSYMLDGKSDEERDKLFWKPIDSDPLFWRNIEPYPWYKHVVELCQDYARSVVLCTKPHTHPNCYGGKRLWIKNYGLGHLQAHFCAEKWRLSRPRTLLIDDYGPNVASFASPQCGGSLEQCYFSPIQLRMGDKSKLILPHHCHGNAILFPQPWNERHPYRHNPLEHLENCLRELTNLED